MIIQIGCNILIGKVFNGFLSLILLLVHILYGVKLMNIRFIKRLFKRDSLDTVGFSLCAGFFLFGALAGAVSANYISFDDSMLLKNYFLAAESGIFESGGLLRSLFDAFLYHAIAVFFGFSAFGFLFLPLLSGVRGFFLTFVAAAVIRALGGGGWLVALALFGLSSFISIPCFFVLSVQAFTASFNLSGALLRRSVASHAIYGKIFFIRCMLCAAALIITALIDAYLSPILASLAAGWI